MSCVLLTLLALALALPVADVLCFVWLHAELPDECLGDGAGYTAYWGCYWSA
jgi:hypothetical protein